MYRVEGLIGAVVLVAAFAFLRHREAEPTVTAVVADPAGGPVPRRGATSPASARCARSPAGSR